MSGLNKIQIIGNLGKDPEIFTFENGDKKASFSAAVTESWKDKEGNKQESTEWFNVVLFRGLATVCESFLKKGSKVYIEGKIKTRKYQDKEGNDRYIPELYGERMLMLSSKDSGQPVEQSAGAISGGEEPDDLPF